MKYYTTDSPNYTDEHNTYMDTLLYSHAEHLSCEEVLMDYIPQIRYDVDYGYCGVNEAGQKMLQHLADIDVIAFSKEIEDETEKAYNVKINGQQYWVTTYSKEEAIDKAFLQYVADNKPEIEVDGEVYNNR